MFLGSDNTPIQSAAGLTMIFTQNQFHTDVDVSDSTVTDTFGQIGSGILATFIDTQNFSTVTLSNVTLIGNNLALESSCSGNALQIVIHYFNSSKIHVERQKWRPIAVANTNISNQSSNAAVFVSVTEQSPVVVVITFQNVSFIDCQSNDRGVCMLAEALYGQADQNTYLQVELLSVTVQHNIINYMPILKPQHLNSDTTSQIFTSGLLTFVNVDVVTLHGDSINPCVFSDNMGPVFTGIATDFQLEGNLLFENNQAITGIVFLLFSFSHMFLKPGLIALFMNNSNYNNREYGSIIKNGASYDNSMCVFQVMTENISAIDINVTFIADNGNNTVPIDAASLYNCRQATLPFEPSHLHELYSQMFHFYGYMHNKTMLSTAENIKFCYKHSNDSVINVTKELGCLYHLHHNMQEIQLLDTLLHLLLNHCCVCNKILYSRL